MRDDDKASLCLRMGLEPGSFTFPWLKQRLPLGAEHTMYVYRGSLNTSIVFPRIPEEFDFLVVEETVRRRLYIYFYLKKSEEESGPLTCQRLSASKGDTIQVIPFYDKDSGTWNFLKSDLVYSD